MNNVELILKTLSYRLLGSSMTVAVGYLATSKMDVSLMLGGCDFLGKLVLYYVFELCWKRFSK